MFEAIGALAAVALLLLKQYFGARAIERRGRERHEDNRQDIMEEIDHRDVDRLAARIDRLRAENRVRHGRQPAATDPPGANRPR